MNGRATAILMGLFALGGGARAEVAIEAASGVEERAERAPSEVHARFDLSQTVSADNQTARHLAFTDLRLTADGKQLWGGPGSFRIDGRARKSFNDLTADRLTPTELYYRLGDERSAWRATLGRQLMRQVASAEIDGLSVERQISENASAVVFGGFMPHPLTNDPNTEFVSAGAGYDQRTDTTNHAGGAVLSLYRGELDRLYLTQRSYLSLGPKWIASGFAILDLLAPRAPFAVRPSGEGLDLTNLNGFVRYRLATWLTSSFSLGHYHTLLPSKWWSDWINQQRLSRGFVLDGEEPVGTRVTSLRWTNTASWTWAVAPYVRLRYDRRHTEATNGTEALVGIKWRPSFGYADVSYAYRVFFQTEYYVGALELGIDRRDWGLDAGCTALHSPPNTTNRVQSGYDLHAAAWHELSGSLKGVRVLAQYQGFLEPEMIDHVVFLQLGYRI